MTVREFIKFLEAQPQDLPVAYRCCSEQRLLEESEIEIKDLKLPRDDGWIHNNWYGEEDVKTKRYLLLPGN